ncbi:uncharacterized protein LOC114333406 [Diabrotica virgifera virgifera]|uniref:Uncharacterized protein LOC114333406 n=1 Tax=Diabrotica virgifera virgifera TaxID=50390 RepID=A0A6P7FWA0_DIAVI|nr:uncharacterized protein LOC114333406 [Diabrotica virgifera virgifera]
MAEDSVITLSSSDEEPTPRKRIKPTPVPNLPNITITKVSAEQHKQPEIVSLCSDDENVVPDDIELTPVNRKKRKKVKNPLHKRIPDPVVICDDEIESPPPKLQSNGGNHGIKEKKPAKGKLREILIHSKIKSFNSKKDSKTESIEINDEDEESTSSKKEAVTLNESIEINYEESTNSKKGGTTEDAITNESIELNDEDCTKSKKGGNSEDVTINESIEINDEESTNSKKGGTSEDVIINENIEINYEDTNSKKGGTSEDVITNERSETNDEESTNSKKDGKSEDVVTNESIGINEEESSNSKKDSKSEDAVTKESVDINDKESSNSKKGSKSEDVIINETIEINDEDIGPESDDNEDKQLLNDLECTFEGNKDGDSENFNKNLSEELIPDDVQPCSSTSAKEPSNTFLLERFLTIIDRNIQNTKYVTIKEKFPMLRTFYNKCIEEYGTSKGFQRLLTDNIAKTKKSAIQSVICFNEVFQHLKEAVKTGSIECDKEQLIKLKKLEKTIKKLVVIIKRLEEAEIDFDQEEDSSYLKMDRYMARLDKVYKKYCELMKKNPYCGRLTYSKLMFLDSEYNEINRAIIKKYKNNKKFPSYCDIEKLITKVVKDSKLKLNESEIKTESKRCFQKLGELLQKRRRKELYESHYTYLEDTEDPASADTDLSSVLKNNYLEGQIKIEKLVEEYVSKQDNKECSDEEEQEEEEEAVSEKSSSDSESEGDDDKGKKSEKT